MRPSLLVITGPTAIGKTALAITLAKHFQTVVVSADSRQVYRELRIGTARPEKAAWQGVPHHLLGDRSIMETYTVADYEQAALEALKTIFSKHNIAIVCGGTGLYIRALCEGLDVLPVIDPSIRASVRSHYVSEGIAYLQQYIQEHDPVSYNNLDLNNPHRLLRAVETHMATGVPLSAWKTGKKSERPFLSIKIGLQLPMTELSDRINKRVDEMLESGLLEEARQLLPYREVQALQTVGYAELFEYFDGKTSLENTVELIKQHTRQYAKRQMTWLRKEEGIKWFSPDDIEGIIRYIEGKIS